tara:strand:- start:51 stop:410 length:360 start_codon:yes stop_codon:yes gene_type:complete
MGLLGVLWGTLWFIIPAEPFATVFNTHRFFSIFFFFTGIFFRAIAFAFLEGLPTLLPYVFFPNGAMMFPMMRLGFPQTVLVRLRVCQSEHSVSELLASVFVAGNSEYAPARQDLIEPFV